MLSTDKNPANKKKIAYVTGLLQQENGLKYPSQNRPPFTWKLVNSTTLRPCQRKQCIRSRSSRLAVAWCFSHVRMPHPWQSACSFQHNHKRSANQHGETLVQESNVVLTAYPNRFSTKLSVHLSVTETSPVTLSLYGMDVALIQVLYKGIAEANQPQQYELNNASLKEGIYVIRLVTKNQVAHKKVIFSK